MGLDGRFKLSLSARRAWIEIACKTSITFETWASLSARRAWIEIILLQKRTGKVVVALRKESVDRNPV